VPSVCSILTACAPAYQSAITHNRLKLCCFTAAEDGQPKIEWPELQGKTADEAKAVLEKEAPGFKIQVIGPDMMATAEYRCERIRIWLNKQQRVSQPPRVG
jgi:hypothetical protein